MITADRLVEIRARCDAATQPPWRKSESGGIIQTQHITRDVWTIPHVEADLDFIAHSRQDIEDLLAEVIRLRTPQPIFPQV